MNKQQALMGKIEVSLGGQQVALAMDTNCLAELEEATGENPFTQEFWNKFVLNLGPKKMRLLFWAMTRSYNPELTVADIGRLLSVENQDALLAMVGRAQEASMGNENTKKNSSRPAGEPRGRARASTGSSSGRLPALT